MHRAVVSDCAVRYCDFCAKILDIPLKTVKSNIKHDTTEVLDTKFIKCYVKSGLSQTQNQQTA